MGRRSKSPSGQIWRLPYLEDGWFERVVDKNVCVKKRGVVVGDNPALAGASARGAIDGWVF